MRIGARQRSFSPSDLAAYLACAHLTRLEVAVALGEISAPRADDAQAGLIRRKGDEHEARYLRRLRDEGKRIVDVAFAPGFDWERAARETESALAGGADVVYQACLVDGLWRGFADFIERQPDGSYEVVDTKLARTPKPEHLFQLCFYSLAVGRIQGRVPERMHLVLGDGRRESFRVAAYDAYYRRIRDDFVAAVESGEATYPLPCAHCGICSFRELCERRWVADDHLVQVAGISRKQVERLQAAGIETLEQLAETGLEAVERMQPETFDRLRAQARLQLHHRRTGEHRVERLPTDERHGFALLPKPSDGDVYYDIEGDPFFAEDGGLEYLHGLVYLEDGEPRFRAIWARDRGEEKRAFEELVEWIAERRRRFPDLHVYHYANYERAALQRLMQLHGTREDELDELLRGHVLVDLYQVVRQALRLSTPSYSLKKVEELYYPGRDTEVLGGDESTVAFERWRETGDESLLDGIERYNEDDCRSTHELHRWLLGLRPPALAWHEPEPAREPGEAALEAQTERELLQARLRAQGQPLLAELLDFHRRSAKPEWWDYFRRLTMDERELVEDSSAIGRIRRDESVPYYPDKKSFVYELTFPPQEFKVGSEAVDPATGRSPGTILAIDEQHGRITFKRGKRRHEEPFPAALVPPQPLPTTEQRKALMRLAAAVAGGSDEYRAAQDVLARTAPRARLDAGPVEAALGLDSSYLFVQGPPGSGKTWTGARMAVELMRRGRRVGVASQSHKAIHKFLDDVVLHAERQGVSFRGLKKASGWDSTRYDGSDAIGNSSENADFAGCDHDLIAGTSWLFAREDVEVDALFVDEAGQVSLADALAIATSARNVVLLGDPNQLPQVTQGAQPAEVRASVLEHLLGDHVTVPPDRGLFLAETWRLCPELCDFVSDGFYEGRLAPADVCRRRSLEAGNGLRFVAVDHSGNRQSSIEEAAWIAAEIRRLLGTGCTDESGRTRALTEADILVVAPYNAQVRCLRSHVPEGIAVGTVDRFQGQQAPVVLFSMTTSTGDDLPRGIEFLFSANRFNVAISRAQCLAYVVASPRLLVADCRTPEQMRLVNTVCRFAERAAAEPVTA